jgi:hypothetical protein
VVRRLVVLCAWVAACRLDVDYSESRYSCVDTRDCPGRHSCVDGACRLTDELISSADAGTDAASLLADPGFEQGVDGWTGYLGTAGLTTTNPHSGAHALRICKDNVGQDGFFSVYRDLIVNEPARMPAGTHFRAQAWVRSSSLGSEPGPSFLSPMLRERGGSSPFLDHYGPTLDAPPPTWTLITADAIITADDRTSLSFVIEAGSEPDGTCFALDDVSIIGDGVH